MERFINFFWKHSCVIQTWIHCIYHTDRSFKWRSINHPNDPTSTKGWCDILRVTIVSRLVSQWMREGIGYLKEQLKMCPSFLKLLGILIGDPDSQKCDLVYWICDLVYWKCDLVSWKCDKFPENVTWFLEKKVFFLFAKPILLSGNQVTLLGNWVIFLEIRSHL